ncbi:hypothetical protein [Streptomyces sp. NPDC058657]|uniref:hypothetical protein n=1 Tax=unclassified Streptomyces TaxID=2593676 RepID=UPI00365FBE63
MLHSPHRPPKFEQEFATSRGRPIVVDGRTVHLTFGTPVAWATARVTLRFVAYVRRPVQGVCLDMSEGDLLINGLQASGITLWADTTPPLVHLEILKPAAVPATLNVWNCWRDERGVRHSWTGNAGFLLTSPTPTSHRFACSDGLGPADFSNLVLTVDIEPRATVLGLGPFTPPAHASRR